MRIFFFFLIIFYATGIFCQIYKIEGKISTVDEKRKKHQISGNPDFHIILYYFQNDMKRICPNPCRVRDKWVYEVKIKPGCNKRYGTEFYLEADGIPSDWRQVNQPSICLYKDQISYIAYPKLEIMIPRNKKPENRQKDFAYAKKIYQEFPEKSLFFLQESARNSTEYQQLAYDFLNEVGDASYAILFLNRNKIGCQGSLYCSDMYGTVVLPDGSAIPGVAVTLTGDAISTKTTVSSEEGNFRFVKLPPGTYQLKHELEGFKTVINKGIRLYVGKNKTLSIQMETGTIIE